MVDAIVNVTPHSARNSARMPTQIIYKGQPLALFAGGDALQEVELQSLEELWIFNAQDVGYSFRGQSDCRWELKSTLERFVEDRKSVVSIENIEQNILFRYRADFSIFANELGYDPRTQDAIDALSDIQHYGGPTRLLDWSKSFFVALFFAVFRNNNTSAAVYCLRNVVFNTAAFDIHVMLDDMKKKGVLIAPGVETSLPAPLDKNKILHFHVPKRRNRRVQHQHAHFIYPGSAEVRFEQALSYTLDDIPITFSHQKGLGVSELKEIVLRSSLIKLIIPNEMLCDVQKFLAKMGISAKTLFPDYHGAIQSLYEVSTDSPEA